MVGHVRDAAGQPVRGLTVSTLETDDRTDDDGRFAVVYKDPDRYVHFTLGDTWFRRTFRPADEGTEVDLRLPALRDATLSCGAQTCDATLKWAIEVGLEARVAARCQPGVSIALRQIPQASPELACRGEGVQPTLVDRGRALALEPPLQPLRVELRALEGALPSDCRVEVGDVEARPAGPGFWVAEIAGRVTVAGRCGGRPARPATVAADVGSVTLEWSPQGPALDLEEVAPWGNRVEILAEDGEEPGWGLVLEPDSGGWVSLPPLSRGRVRVRIDGSTPAPGDVPDVVGRADVLVLTPMSTGESLVGVLEVAGDLLDGTVPIAMVPPVSRDDPRRSAEGG